MSCLSLALFGFGFGVNVGGFVWVYCGAFELLYMAYGSVGWWCCDDVLLSAAYVVDFVLLL